MNSLKLITLLGISLLLSCSTKSNQVDINQDFTAGLDQMKSKETKAVHRHDFLVYADETNLDMLLKEERATFVVFGMVTNDYSDFERKYGIKVRTENCVITPGISKIALVNNRIISDYLNEKFSTDWIADLGMLPFGLN